jgi:kumamolisin
MSDDSNRGILRHSEKNPPPGSDGLGSIDLTKGVSVTFVLSIDSDQLRAEADAVARKAICERKYYTPDELKRKYPPDPNGVTAVEVLARKHKLDLVPASPGDRLRHVIVPAAKARDLFRVERTWFPFENGGAFRGTTGRISFDSGDLSAAQIDGLRGVFGSFSQSRATGNSIAGIDPVRTSFEQVQPVLPKDLKGDHQTIGILEFGGSLSDADLPRILGVERVSQRVHVVTPKAFVPTRGVEFTREAAVDGQIVTGLLPHASVVFYSLPDNEQGWIIGLQHILFEDSHHPEVLSISWGYPELRTHGGSWQWTSGAIHTIEDLFASAVLLGTTVCCSSGDSGPGGWPPGVNYPASSPYVLGCGGTMFNGQEVVWCNGQGSSGGGISDMIPRPSWQDPGRIKVTVDDLQRPKSSLDGRRLPDVAANALFSSVSYGYVWGTSVAAPRWAALIAAANQAIQRRVNLSAGNITALFYDESTGLQSSCNDVVSGNNAWPPHTGHCYRASSGWNACTGWGSPRANEVIDALVQNALSPDHRKSWS